jgi:hypothetical protein
MPTFEMVEQFLRDSGLRPSANQINETVRRMQAGEVPSGWDGWLSAYIPPTPGYPGQLGTLEQQVGAGAGDPGPDPRRLDPLGAPDIFSPPEVDDPLLRSATSEAERQARTAAERQARLALESSAERQARLAFERDDDELKEWAEWLPSAAGWGGDATDLSTMFTLDEAVGGGFPAYQRGLRARGLNPGIGGGVFGNFLGGRFAPIAATFLGEAAASGRTGLSGVPADIDAAEFSAPFASFAGEAIGQGRGLGARAERALNALINLGGAGGAGSASQRFTAPTDFKDFILGADLAREAARGRLGGFAASQLLPTSASFMNEFLSGPMATQQAQYLPFLKRRYGLNRPNPFAAAGF